MDEYQRLAGEIVRALKIPAKDRAAKRDLVAGILVERIPQLVAERKV